MTNEHTPPSVSPQVGGTHYDKYDIQPVTALRDWLTPEEYRGWLRGNALKYQVRYRDKNGIEDLKKAQWFVDELTRFEKEQAGALDADKVQT